MCLGRQQQQQLLADLGLITMRDPVLTAAILACFPEDRAVVAMAWCLVPARYGGTR